MRRTHEPAGCLGVLLGVFGRTGRGWVEEELPYRLRDDFLSPAERSFYWVLQGALADAAVICPKVNLADVFFVARPRENQAYRNKIDRKHVDFLLCDQQTMRPLCGVELDDASHARKSRADRDAFVDEVFAAAELPLVRVRVRAGYNPQELRDEILPRLGGAGGEGRERGNTARTARAADRRSRDERELPDLETRPMCRQCQVEMVERTAKRGSRAGERFYGCPNYPRCRETAGGRDA